MKEMRKLLELKNCGVCDKEFIPYRIKKHIYCSSVCNNKARSKRESRRKYMNEYLRNYYKTETGRKSMQASHRKWERSIKGRVFRKNNKALRRHSDGRFTAEEWMEMLTKFSFRCAKCSSENQIQADHIIPISKGGANTINNIQPLCKPCNLRKSATL